VSAPSASLAGSCPLHQPLDTATCRWGDARWTSGASVTALAAPEVRTIVNGTFGGRRSLMAVFALVGFPKIVEACSLRKEKSVSETRRSSGREADPADEIDYMPGGPR